MNELAEDPTLRLSSCCNLASLHSGVSLVPLRRRFFARCSTLNIGVARLLYHAHNGLRTNWDRENARLRSIRRRGRFRIRLAASGPDSARACAASPRVSCSATRGIAGTGEQLRQGRVLDSNQALSLRAGAAL